MLIFRNTKNKADFLNAMGVQIMKYSSSRQTLISWNSYLSVSHLMEFHYELSSRLSESQLQ